MSEHFDVIVVGTGAGGGSLAHTLAPTGKKILLLERGTFLTRELGNWDPGPVFVDGKYISTDTWYDGEGTPFQPQVHYFVGGATKMYGGARRFGTDPATSVLDVNCKAHELDNLYVADTSLFPSIGAVNPGLTAIALGIRAGEHIAERLGATGAGAWAPQQRGAPAQGAAAPHAGSAVSRNS